MNFNKKIFQTIPTNEVKLKKKLLLSVISVTPMWEQVEWLSRRVGRVPSS